MGKKSLNISPANDIGDVGVVQNGSRMRNSSAPSITSKDSTGGSTGKGSMGNESTDEVGLKKRVGLISGISLIVGTMIGSGIFISPKGVAEGSGSVGLSLVSWTICGVISMLGALSLGELGTMIPESGGEYVYLREAFGKVIAYMCAWTSITMIKPSSVSIIALTCAEYIMVSFFDDGCGMPPKIPIKLVAAIVIVIITWLNCYSVKLAARVQVIFTAAKLLAMAIIIVGGIVKLAQGNTQYLDTGFDGTSNSVGLIAIGLYNGMWAYDGWNNLNYVTEEIINPYRNLPLAIMIGIPLVTVLYLLVNISYFSVMSITELLDSPAVAVTWAESVIEPAKWIIPIFVALSTFGAANGTMFSGGRLTYVAAREGHMVEILSMVHVKRFTPLPSLVFTCIIALLMIIPGDIGSLIDFFSFAVWLFYGATMVAVVVLRFTQKDAPRPYKVPIVFPIFVAIVSAYLVVAPIIDDPRMEFLYAAIFILAGFIFYVPFVHYKFVLPGMDGLTTFSQLLMEVSPPVDESEL